MLNNEIIDAESNCRSTSDDDEPLPSKRTRIATDNSSLWKITADVDHQYRDNVASRNAIAISLKDKKKISDIVKKLDKHFAFEEKDRFIKRVRIKEDGGIWILVHIFETKNDNCTVEGFRTKYQDQLNNLETEINKCDVFTTAVPSKNPKTREQFKAAKDIWPCHFHENKRLESTLNATREDIWGTDSLKSHVLHMQHTLNSCIKSGNAAVVVDPKTYAVFIWFKYYFICSYPYDFAFCKKKVKSDALASNCLTGVKIL